MSRLINCVKSGKFYLKVVLDNKGVTTNYIQKSKGCVPSPSSSDCECIQCMESINWLKWNKASTKASGTCECGQKATLEIIDFHGASLKF